MIGVIKIKGSSISETINSDSKHLEKTRMRVKPAFFIILSFFHDFGSHFGVQTTSKTIKKTIRKSMQNKTSNINLSRHWTGSAELFPKTTWTRVSWSCWLLDALPALPTRDCQNMSKHLMHITVLSVCGCTHTSVVDMYDWGSLFGTYYIFLARHIVCGPPEKKNVR